MASPLLRIRLRELLREKALREGRDPEVDPITQMEVAHAIGVAQGTISAWMRDNIERMDKTTIVMLCRYLECEIQDLLHIPK